MHGTARTYYDAQALGAAATTITRDIHEGAIIDKILITMKCLGNTGAATRANMLTQFGTNVQIAHGSNIFEMSMKDLHDLNGCLFQQPALLADGTAANDTLNAMTVCIPFGRIMDYQSPLIVDPIYGLKPTKTVQVKLTIPADGGTLDTRTVDIGAIIRDGTTQGYIERLVSAATATATGYGTTFTLPAGNNARLYDLMLFQTSKFNGNLAADACGVADIALYINSRLEVLEKCDAFMTGHLSRDDTTNDEHLYYRFDPPKPLVDKSWIDLNMGVAEAVRSISGIVRS